MRLPSTADPSSRAARVQPGIPRDAILAGLLVAATLLAYAPALPGGVLWDDPFHLTAPSLQSSAGLRMIWFKLGATQQYYPLLHSAFWVEHRLWGDTLMGYHLVTVVFHAAAALLFWALLRRLTIGGAWLAAFLFALHPVCVESVAWISEQKNTLSLVFYLAAALAYLRYARDRRLGAYLLATALFVLALMTKSVTATLPAALLLVLAWKEGSSGLRRHWRPLWPWLGLGTAAGLFTAWVERVYIGAAGNDFVLGWPARFIMAGRALGFYAGKLIWPIDLVFVYPRWKIDPGQIGQYAPLAGCLVVLAGLIALRRRMTGTLTAALFFAGTLFPALGFFTLYPFAFSSVADHFQYVAMLGPIALVAAGWSRWNASAAHRAVPLAVATATVGGLALLTAQQCFFYTDSETLYRETLRHNPGSAMAHHNLGVILAASGRPAEARVEFEEALSLKPNYPEADNNLADLFARTPGMEAAAISRYHEALTLRPDYYVAADNLATVWARRPLGWEQARLYFDRALTLKPDYAKGHNDLAIALGEREGGHEPALREYRQALLLDPAYADAHANYAFELSKDLSGSAAAAREYEEAIRLDPANAETQNNFANLLVRLPAREAEAEAHYRTALRLHHGYAEAHNNLANELIKDPAKATEALWHYEAAVRLRPDYADAQNNLAIAYANLGRTAEAIAHFQAALTARPNFPEARANLELLRSSGR